MTRIYLRLMALTLVASAGLVAEVRAANFDLDKYESPLVLLPPIEWTGLDPRSPEVQQYFNGLSKRGRQEYFHSIASSRRAQAYFRGAIETFSFFAFMNLPRTIENEQAHSDGRQCAVDNRNRSWQIASWLRGYSANEPAARGVIIGLAHICESYAGKGSGGWTPVELVSKGEWQEFSAIEREFYVSAYFETALEATVMLQHNNLVPRDGRVESLVQCITEHRVEKILKTLEETEIDMQFPLPWTVSKAVEVVCAG